MVTIPWHLDSTEPIIQQHVINGRAVLPFASWLNRCLVEVTALQGHAPRELLRVLVRKPVVFEAGASKTVQFIGKPELGMGRFEVREDDSGTERSSPGLPLVEGAWQDESDGGPLIPAIRSGPIVDHDAFYEAAIKAGFLYGPLLRRVKQVQTGGSVWSADLLPLNDDREPSIGRATTWDALLQSGTVMAAEGGNSCWVPFRIDRMRFRGDESGASIGRLYGEWIRDSSSNSGQRLANICAFDDDLSSPRLELRGVHYRVIDQLTTEAPDPLQVGEAPTVTAVRPESILGKLRSATSERRRSLLIRFIEDQLLEVLQWDDSRRDQLAAGFVAIGVDSLMSVDLQYRLQTALDFALPLGEGFEAVSVQELADSMLQKYLKID